MRSYLDSFEPAEFVQRIQQGTEKNVDPDEIKVRLEAYQKSIERLKENLPVVVSGIRKWLDEHSLHPKQKPEEISVMICDPLLHAGRHPDTPSHVDDHFDPKTNTIYLRMESDLSVLAHEFFHAMSFEPGKTDVGFRTLVEGENDVRGNFWLDEGTAMIGEFATYPTTEPNKRDRRDALYEDGYYWLTQIFRKELGMSETDLLKAYFGEDSHRVRLEEKTKERFGCSLFELQNIFLGFSEEAKADMLKIIRGEPD